MDNMKILVMFVQQLDIPAREGHNGLSGTSVEYFFYGSNGELVSSKLCVDGTVGMRRGKSFLPPDSIRKVSYVPGVYDGVFEMAVGSDGKPTLKLTDLNFVGRASISMVHEKEVK